MFLCIFWSLDVNCLHDSKLSICAGICYISTQCSIQKAARWFDEDWNAQFDSPEWNETVTFYVNLMNDAGPPGASSNGFNENLALFQTGKCAMWIDATVAASFVSNPDDSQVADSVGFPYVGAQPTQPCKLAAFGAFDA